MVEAVDADPGERVLDVASGTGLVARALVRRYGCSGRRPRPERGDALPGALEAGRRSGDLARRIELVQRRGRGAPFRRRRSSTTSPSPTCCATSTIPPRPCGSWPEWCGLGGRVACSEFHLPARAVAGPVAAPTRRLGAAAARPARLARLAARSGSFLGPSIEGFYERFPARAPARDLGRWPGSARCAAKPISLGGGNRDLGNPPWRLSAARPSTRSPRAAGATWSPSSIPPYTLWHLSYVAIGAAAAPRGPLEPPRLGAARLLLRRRPRRPRPRRAQRSPPRNPALRSRAEGDRRRWAAGRPGDRGRRRCRRLADPRSRWSCSAASSSPPTTSSCSAGASTPTGGSPRPGGPFLR